MTTLERYCPFCKEFFELDENCEELGNVDFLHGCGESSIPADKADVKSDAEIYEEEAPR